MPEARAKYDADELKKLGAEGHAFKTADGYDYPIDDLEDLENAIKAVGRGNADHDAIRLYVMGRAKQMGQDALIPDTWQSDGSLKDDETKSAGTPLGRAKKRRHRAGPIVGREFRFFSADGLEVRSADDGSNNIVITGMPIVYNAPYQVRDMFGTFEETMLPGVADTVIQAGADVRFLFNHDGLPLARTTSGTLTLDTTNTRGLGMTATLDSRQQLANDLAIAIERGDVNQMSCGFVVGNDDWNAAQDERSIAQFEQLFDVSGVTYPASPTTSIELAYRSLFSKPIESQARLRQMWVAVGKDLRAGKVLSAENAGHLQTALDALHAADDVDIPGIVKSLQAINDALDGGQAGLSHVLNKANPDGDPNDMQPALVPPGAPGDTSATDDDGTGEGAGTGAEPPNEAQDGTGSRMAAPATAAERRAASGSFNDTEQAVSQAITVKFADPDDTDPWCDLWLQDCGPDWAVFQSWEEKPGPGLWKIGYSIDASNEVTLTGDPQSVAVETNYVPVERAADITDESRDAAAVSLLEIEAEQLRLRGRKHHTAA